MEDRIDILLSKYFSGEATDVDLADLDNWLSECEEHEAHFNRMTLLYQQSALIDTAPKVDVDKAYSKFEDYISLEKKEAPKKKSIRFPKAAIYAAASIALLIGVFLLVGKQDKVVEFASLQTEEYHRLNEEIEVLLSENSKIKYDESNPYEVELLGEAKFIINSKTDKKLLVKVGNAFIRDIGTIFTVSAYAPMDSIQVRVEEGEIQFTTPTNKDIAIRKDENATYIVSKDDFVIHEERQFYDFHFNNSHLKDVLKLLQERYGVAISMQANEDATITADFNSDDSLEDILSIVAETLSLEITGNESDGFLLKSLSN